MGSWHAPSPSLVSIGRVFIEYRPKAAGCTVGRRRKLRHGESVVFVLPVSVEVEEVAERAISSARTKYFQRRT